MKALFLQLARFGDIYLTWPMLRALREANPTAELHMVVRRRFRAAVNGLSELDCVWQMDTRSILEPIFSGENAEGEALSRLNHWVDELRKEGFSHIFNLSFSPFSSYLTSALATPTTEVKGYARHLDGFLSIPDDTSAYFYAQVGLGRVNRFHVTDIFAAMMGVDLHPIHWRPPEGLLASSPFRPEGRYMLVHVGASQAAKTYPAFKWRRALAGVLNHYAGQILLIGSKDERSVAEAIVSEGGFHRLQNLVGMTRLEDLFALLRDADLLVGADSAPMHMASLVQCPCLNLSLGGVNFWETGPRSRGSRILVAESAEALPSDRVSLEIISLIKGEDSGFPHLSYEPGSTAPYVWRNWQERDWPWRFIKGLYCGAELPAIDTEINMTAFVRLRDMVNVCLEQLPHLLDVKKRSTANEILQQADQIFLKIAELAPDLKPLVSWFFTEKLRVGPASLENLIEVHESLYLQFKHVLDVYLKNSSEADLTEG